MKKLFVYTFLILSIVLTACQEALIGPEAMNTPEKNFELLWQEYDRMYGTFAVKNINWLEIYNQYRPQVTSSTTDQELFTIMSRMLDHLDYNHVYLKPPRNSGLPNYTGGTLGRVKLEDYDAEVVDKYLTVKKRMATTFNMVN